MDRARGRRVPRRSTAQRPRRGHRRGRGLRAATRGGGVRTVPVAVNTAIAEVANRDGAAGLTEYAGHTAATDGPRTGYLIGSNQDRTDNNPQPSTIICLLQGPDDGPLVGSARR